MRFKKLHHILWIVEIYKETVTVMIRSCCMDLWSIVFLTFLLALTKCQINEDFEIIYSTSVFDYRNETFYIEKRANEGIFPTILNKGFKNNYINSLWIDNTKSDTYFTSIDNCIYIILNGTARIKKFAGNGFPGI